MLIGVKIPLLWIPEECCVPKQKIQKHKKGNSSADKQSSGSLTQRFGKSFSSSFWKPRPPHEEGLQSGLLWLPREDVRVWGQHGRLTGNNGYDCLKPESLWLSGSSTPAHGPVPLSSRASVCFASDRFCLGKDFFLNVLFPLHPRNTTTIPR